MSRRALVFNALVLATSLTSGCVGVDRQGAKTAAIRSGDDLTAEKDYAQAAGAYRRAVEADPSDGPLRVKLARAHERAQQWAEAADQAMRAADLMPADFDARFLAARLILGQSRFDDSLAISTALLRERPGDVDVLVLWGTASARLINSTWALYSLASTGGIGPQYEEGCTSLRPPVRSDQENSAEAALREAVDLAPGSFDARLALVNFLWAARRASESAELLRSAADESPMHAVVAEAAGHFFLARHQDELGEKYLTNAAASSAAYSRAPRLALADHYFAIGRFADALIQLAQMTQADDQAGLVSIRKADAALRLGRYAAVAEELDAILAKYPKHSRGLALKAQLLLKTGRTDEALVTARSAVAADLTVAESRVVLAETLSQAGDMNGAFTEYAEAFRLDPKLTRLVPTLARLGLETGRNREALVYAQQAAALFPDDADVAVTVATAHVRLRDYSAAAMALAPLLRQQPQRADIQIQLGLLEAGRGNVAAARAALEASLRVDPSSVDAVSGLVALDLERGLVTEARARVTRLSATQPNEPAVMMLVGRVFRAEGDLARAEQVLRSAMTLRPGDADVAVRLADCLVAMKREDAARAVLEQALKRQGPMTAVQTALGGVLERLGQIDEAQALYEGVLLASPGDPVAASRLAMLYVARGRNLDVAVGFLADAKRASPDDPDLSDALGWVYVQKNLHALALRHLEDAARARPKNAKFQYHLGVAYARTGQVANARAALAQSLVLEASFGERPAAQGALAALPR